MPGGIAGNEREGKHQRDQHDEGHALAQVDALAAPEQHVADHRYAGEDGQHGGVPAQVVAGEAVVDAHPHHAGDQRRRGRAGQALEVALVDHVDVGVEARQAQRGAGAVDEGRDPAELAEVLQRPFVHHQRRGGAEGDHVGQRVVLGAELALGVGQARNAAVEAVEHHGDEDRHRGVLEALVHRLHDRIEAGEQRRGGEQVRQDVDAAAALVGQGQRGVFDIGHLGCRLRGIQERHFSARTRGPACKSARRRTAVAQCTWPAPQ
jgi:hypothetical protein